MKSFGHAFYFSEDLLLLPPRTYFFIDFKGQVSPNPRGHATALHKVWSCAPLTHSAYDMLLLYPLISSIHILLDLPRSLLASTFPSSNNFYNEFLRVI